MVLHLVKPYLICSYYPSSPAYLTCQLSKKTRGNSISSTPKSCSFNEYLKGMKIYKPFKFSVKNFRPIDKAIPRNLIPGVTIQCPIMHALILLRELLALPIVAL